MHACLHFFELVIEFSSGKFEREISVEPGRKEHVQWISNGEYIVYQQIGMELHFHKTTSQKIEYHMSLAHRIYLQFEHTGNMVPAQRKAKPELRALDELLMIGTIIKKTQPSISRKSVSISFPF